MGKAPKPTKSFPNNPRVPKTEAGSEKGGIPSQKAATKSRTRRTNLELMQLKDRAIALRIQGLSYKGIAHELGYVSLEGFLAQRNKDPDFRRRLEAAKPQAMLNQVPEDLETFRDVVFGHATFPHMRQWATWADDPEADHILIVTCPNTAKTSFFSEWLLHKIAKRPQTRAGYFTFSQEKATDQVDFLRRIIEENAPLRAMVPLAPEDSRPWSSTRFMVGPRAWSGAEAQADPTLAAYGHDSQVAKARLDIALIDDIDAKRHLSPEERRRIWKKIRTEIETRLGPGGRMVVICNRWDHEDIAGLIQQVAKEHPGSWKVFDQKAIIRQATDDPEDFGEVIWPERFGRDPKQYTEDDPVLPGQPWTPRRAWNYFAKKKIHLGPEEFALLYLNDPQGAQVNTFSEDSINAAIERGRGFSFGAAPPDSIVICAQDPASDRGCGTIAVALRPDGMLQVVDATWRNDLGTDGMLEEMRFFGEYFKRSPRWWAIEAQGPWKAHTEGPAVKEIVRQQRAQLEPLRTGENKRAQDIGIGTLVPVISERLIIPWATFEDQERMFHLVSQIKDYRAPDYIPGNPGRFISRCGPTDMVMALWFVWRLMLSKGLQSAAVSPPGADQSAWHSRYRDSWSGGNWSLTRS